MAATAKERMLDMGESFMGKDVSEYLWDLLGERHQNLLEEAWERGFVSGFPRDYMMGNISPEDMKTVIEAIYESTSKRDKKNI